ncbi:MAG: hypothetical protein ISS31_00610 [Kiritimatiellae bacterium]|nr:hypothetical protein [Kiritimatiellia bacterium]
MTRTSLNKDLGRIGRTVRRWDAQVRMMIASAVLLGGLFVFVLSDLLLQFGRPARFTVFVLLLGVLGATIWWLMRAVRHPLTPQAVAASVERAFPELDSHLINYLQFASAPGDDPFKSAYLRRDIKGWNKVSVKQMKNRRLHHWAFAAFSVTLAVMLLPTALTGRAWATAVWRVTNPFANTPPVSLTQLLGVTPGTTTAPQGKPVVLACKVSGQRGHRVLLDVKPADGDTATHTLGTIKGDPEERFSHRIPLLTTAVRYRFRAGDAPFPEWFEVTPRPPLACTAVELTVTPPSYTGITPARFDGLADEMAIPEGSRVTLTLTCNGALTSASVQMQQDTPVPLRARPAGEENVRTAELTITEGTRLSISATDTFGEQIETEVAFMIVPDNAPVITIIAPTGRPTLPPGSKPTIDFTVDDDYGVANLVLQRVKPGSKRDEDGKEVGRWTPSGAESFATVWSEAVDAEDGRAIGFRIVARDNRPDRPHIARSETILFNAASMTDTSKQQTKAAQEVASTLGKLIEMQRDNIARTRTCQSTLMATTAQQWNEAAEQQRQIRMLTRELLATPGEPLGSLTAPTKKLYLNEMQEVIDVLARLPVNDNKATLSTDAINMEEKILRQLTYAQAASAQTSKDQRVSALSNMLDALVRGEARVVKATQEYVKTKAKVGSRVVDTQDELAEDLTDFVHTCRQESAAVRANDQAFAATLTDLATRCDSAGIRDDMMLAAEDLDNNQPADALPDERQALSKLEALQKHLSAIKTSGQAEREEEMLDVLQHAGEKLEKIRAIHEKAIQAMEMVKEQKDASSEEAIDMMEEEYQEIVKNTKQALLEIPTDLHIFAELSVANELVEDVFSVFEEHEIMDEEEKEAAGIDMEDPTEKAYAKRDRQNYLEAMGEAEERIEDLEQWLQEEAEDDVITTEAFDKEEMPEEGVALGALAAQAEDLIGDLLEEAEEGAEDAEDGATNHGMGDVEAGWEVKEGDTTSFGAKGKSGNMTPDHKEQDGRSNVGRQGMAVGENASGSGTIGEGDPNMEARRTQDPTQDGQVDLDGEADTAATGGGKQASGKADDVGMGGGTRRMDSTEEGSLDGMEALMAKQADTMYTKASLKNVRADSLKNAAHHLRQAADAIAEGHPIEQIKEHRKQAVVALKRARTQLQAGPASTLTDGKSSALLDDVLAAGPDEAPPRYRDLVADYYKKLNETL